ncbi:hypothetical protein PsorP6_004535 [Peronosclerospora sorghi]|uniref:Uncharacterized protein n=1 Tax=Peronosclerospora sorghi TaxID=230839 RepID=A0ACC0VQY4_9STRA|nr:hypothetical protein PsorP6_004535 [Peronosclerospora sorghi]
MAGARRGKSRKLRKAAPVSDPAKAKEDADIDEASNDRPVELNQASKGDEKVVTPKRGKQKTIKSKNGKKTLVNVDVEKSYNEGEEVPNASKRKPSNSKSGKKQQVKMESLDSGMEEKPKASKWEASKSKSGMKEQMIVDSSDTEDDESMMAGNYYGSPNIHDDRDEEKLLESSGSSNEDERKNNMISFDTNKTEKDDEKVESLVSSDSSDDSGGDEHYHKELNRTPVKVQEPTGNRPKEKVKQCETQHEKHDDDSELRLGTMRRLLTFLPQKKLIEIVSLAATQYDQLYNHLKVAVGSSVVHRKVFVRELAWDTKSEKLKEAFACFGEIQDASIINNTTEGTSSVYGVVIFNDMEAAQRAVQKKCLVIDVR